MPFADRHWRENYGIEGEVPLQRLQAPAASSGIPDSLWAKNVCPGMLYSRNPALSDGDTDDSSMSEWVGNSWDTILNSQFRHWPLESATETPSMNLVATHDPLQEGLRSAHGQEEEYGGSRIKVVGAVTCNESGIPFACDSGPQQQPLLHPDVLFRPIPGVPDTYLGMNENVLCPGPAR